MNAHLTRLTLNRHARHLTRDVRAMHALIEFSLGDNADRPPDAPRTLWAMPRHTMLIIQAWRTVTLDAWTGMVDDHHHTPVPTAWHPGDPVEISLIASPTRFTRRRPDGTMHPDGKGRRTPRPPHEWVDWLTERVGHAVDLREVATEPMRTRVGHKPGHRITFAQAGFHAVGTVLDPEALTHLQIAGVGSQRAYGCGLLLARGWES